MNVVLLVMKAGDRLEEYPAPSPFSLSVPEGRIHFMAAEEVAEAGPILYSPATPGYGTRWKP
jgi:hypothetical protein